MSILGDRIKKERENSDLTREELAQKIGVSYSAIAMYEQGNREPNNELILKLCDIFNCTIDYLLGNSDFKTNEDALNNCLNVESKITILKTLDRYYDDFIVTCQLKDSDIDEILNLLSTNNNFNSIEKKKIEIETFLNKFEIDKKEKVKRLLKIILEELVDSQKSRANYHYWMSLIEQNKKNSDISNSKQYYMCPVYGQISAGQPNWAEQNIEGRIPIDVNLMDILNPEEYFFLRVNGESMNKVIRNGAFALIHKQDIVENGEIAVVLVNGYDATLKKFSRQGDLIILEPQSDDDSFSTQVYDKNTTITVLGKYVGKMEINK